MLRFVTAVLGLSIAVAFTAAAEVTLTPETTKIEWVGTKPGGKHTGGFKKVTGTIANVTPDLAGSKISVEIDADSLYSDNPKLTAHLKSPDFFDVKKHGKAKFESTAIAAGGSGGATHTVSGNLTLHGVTKEVSFPATVSQTGKTFKLTSKFTIDRKDFGMTFGEGKVDNPVTITVAVTGEAK